MVPVAAVMLGLPALAVARTEMTIGIGTQDTTTNTVAGGVVIKNLKLLEKYLPHTGKYADIDYKLDWENFTSGPPVTNAMMADKLQIGMMGDYPLLVNGATGQKLDGDQTELIAVLAYNANGAGNGVVVNKNSPYYKLSDLKGKTISTPFGSAAYGMLMAVMKKNGWSSDYWSMANQSPEVGSTAIQQNKIDAHADFVPFAELLPYRGFARKIFDGAETGVPTFHAVVVRKDFAQKYPEIAKAYLNALLDANAWIQSNPQQAAEKVQEWTHIDKEVAYIFLSPNGIDTLDPTLKPLLLNSLDTALANLKTLGSIKTFDKNAWINDSYLRAVYKQRGLDYDKQLQSLDNYEIKGFDPICKTDVTTPKLAGEIWLTGQKIVPTSSASCTLMGVSQYLAQGKKIDVAYVIDHSLGIKLFADKAYYAGMTDAAKKAIVVPFLLKEDAEKFAASNGGKLMDYPEALTFIGSGGK
jgi:NitT/TauT family transport system substrate-binding protein